ncbi:MAG TPA: hypothetical protein VM073_12140 [Usitatibacter sp.]|nr:hypothetical protein [Usitatibacter sp.]
MNLLILATIAIGLAVDQHWAFHGQLAVAAATWLILCVVWSRSSAARPALAACLVYATAGEVFLSLVWRLYEYRLGNIPLFVPPGHVLLFFVGMQIAERIPARSEWWIAALAAPLVAAFAWNGRDTLGPLLYGLFLACLWLSPSRRLYATMFVLSLAMELYGTWMGNWMWSPRVPWLGLTSANPPLAAGAFYCILDLLVVMTVNKWGQSQLSITRTFRQESRPLSKVDSDPTYSYPASGSLKPSVASHQAATCSARSSPR